MKANELMIGDWVNTPNGISRVIYIAKYSGIYTDNTNIGEKLYSPYEINPIPLTPEILEKNGFKKDKETDQWYFDSNDRLDMGILAIGIDDGCGVGICVMRNGAITYYCKYVHELQHFLRVIGGAKEIEI